MSGSPSRALIVGALCALAATSLAACGSSDTSAGSNGQRGGTLKLLTQGDLASLDPGAAYEAWALTLLAATQRPLYRYAPDDPEHPVPDLAAGQPQISADGKTLTVKLRGDVRFSPRSLTAR